MDEIRVIKRGDEVIRLRLKRSEAPPERQAAIDHFNALGLHTIVPFWGLPDCVYRMTPQEAQSYLDSLDAQPTLYEFFRVGPKSTAVDQDLAPLQYLPEITNVSIGSNRISDVGIEHLKHLVAVKHVFIASDALTDRCLTTIAQLQSLESLHLGFCPNISRRGAIAKAAKLARLSGFAPPHPRGLYRWLRLCLVKLKLTQKFDPHVRPIP